MSTEAMKLALDDLISEYYMENSSFAKRVADIFKEAPTQPQQEPVAWMHKIDCDRDDRDDFMAYYKRTPGYCIPLYTSPQTAQRKPLTTQEIRKWWASENSLEDCVMSKLDDFEQVVRAIEAKLKEKNT